MVIDSSPSHGYKQKSCTVTQTGYAYPQAGYPYGAPPIGMGYNTTPVPQLSTLPMSNYNSHPYGNGHDHGNGHGHGHGHKHNGMNTYSAGAMGYGGNQCPPVGYTAVKYDNVYSTYKEADD